jgi:hypothetical protein
MTAEYRGSHSLALVEMKLAWRKYKLCVLYLCHLLEVVLISAFWILTTLKLALLLCHYWKAFRTINIIILIITLNTTVIMDGKPTQNSSCNFPQGDNMVYNTLIRSTVTYASEIWVLKENVINKLMTFKREIMRKIYGYTRTEDGYWRIKTNHTKRTKYN